MRNGFSRILKLTLDGLLVGPSWLVSYMPPMLLLLLE